MGEDNLPRQKLGGEGMTEDNENDEVGLEKDIRIDEERPSFSSQDEMMDLRRESEIQRLSHRMTLLFILIPCLICAVLGFFYLDLNDKLGKMKSTGSRDLQTLSEEVIGKVGSLSEELKTLSGRLSALEKTSVSMKEAIDKDGRAIQKVNASKIGKGVLEKALKKHSAEVANTVEVLKKDLDNYKKSVDSLAKNLEMKSANHMKTLTALDSEVRGQKKSIQGLNGSLAEVVRVVNTARREGQNKVDKEELEALLKKNRAMYETRMLILEKQITTLKEEISRSEGQATLPPDKIIEQEITE